jgi:hypothetical protein
MKILLEGFSLDHPYILKSPTRMPALVGGGEERRKDVKI